ncbi:MAG TPA: FecR domain-containing protein [Polyangia bacterium]|nr:FecR domain-containing protein [Polyangia bacterium]
MKRPGDPVTAGDRALQGQALEDQGLIDRLSDAARRAAVSQNRGDPAPGVWHRLEARRRDDQLRRPRGRWTWVVTCAGAAALVLAVRALAPLVHSARPLTFEVAGGILEEGGYVRGDDQRGGQLRFSDGTRIRLAPGAKLSVGAPGARGARLRLQDGEAHFEVMHLPRAAWTVEAGPYVVEVTGTVFDVRWSGANEVAEVHLRSGSVRVSGPLLAEHATLHPGQSLVAHIAEHELRIEEDRPAAPPAGLATPARSVAAPSAPVAPVLAVPPPGAATAAVVPATQRAKKPRRRVALLEPPQPPPPRPEAEVPAWAPHEWTGRVTAGDTKGVLDEAEAHGLDSVLAEADGPALVALADAARYAGRRDLAARALLKQRERFPDTPAASNAAFFLGRLADDAGRPTDALDWYRRCFVERPHGAYASEALGRAMLAVSRISGKTEARDMARIYLERFPNGTYLLHAHQILANP